MTNIFILYGLISGMAMFLTPTQYPNPKGLAGVCVFLACLLMGWIVMPAKLLVRLVRG